MSETAHYDGGRLIATTVTHDHVEHHPDGSVSAVAVTGVPARVCEICSAAFYDDDIGFLLAEVIRENLPPAGQAVTVAFPGRQAA